MIGRAKKFETHMLRLIEGKKMKSHTNMQRLRERIHMMSVNQMAIYHTALEMFNIIQHSSSDTLREKLTMQQNTHYQLRNRKNGEVCVPKRPKKNALGFTYHGATLWKHLPKDIRMAEKPGHFKSLLKKWIWVNIPSI